MPLIDPEEEKELAAYFRAHKDDPDEWGEPAPATTSHKRGQLSATVTVRLTPEEYAILRGRSQATGETYSEVLRAALRRLKQPVEVGTAGTHPGMTITWP